MPPTPTPAPAHAHAHAPGLPAVNLAALPPKFAQAVDAIRTALRAQWRRLEEREEEREEEEREERLERLEYPRWGIVCGSGLSGLASTLEDKIEVPYSSIPGFSHSSVPGHRSALAFGFLSHDGKRVPVVACLGRFHAYEGHEMEDCVFPVRVMRCLGTQAVVVTNAAGGLNPDFEVGTIVAMHDHLSMPSLTFMNPLKGPNLDALGTRFPPLSDAYDIPLRLSALRAADAIGLSPSEMQEGTYAYVLGPTYESRAEARFLRAAGADCVGMSTVPEVIAARHAGMRVLALSLITNKVVVSPYFDSRAAVTSELAASASKAGKTETETERGQVEKDRKEAANHEEVLEVGRRRAEDMRRLVEAVVCGSDV